ncbi:ribosome maturation factor RimM [Melioribacter sp. OK-6-Me]|uniref:ribosome maturation factor RimM n=1 Tax=unclassified Melioribacter TaxID=2627329 RepID=UPI003EDB23F2
MQNPSVNDLILIAVVKSVAGEQGFFAVDSYSDFIERFFNLDYVYAEFFGNVKRFEVEESVVEDDRVLLKIKGFDTAEDAALFIGKRLFVDEENKVELDDFTFFIHDLIGSKVYRAGFFIGTIEDVWVLKSNDVYVIKDNDGKEILFPAIKNYIKNFDAVKKRLDLTDDSDLLYDNED